MRNLFSLIELFLNYYMHEFLWGKPRVTESLAVLLLWSMLTRALVLPA